MYQDMLVDFFSNASLPEYQLVADPVSTRSEVSDVK